MASGRGNSTEYIVKPFLERLYRGTITVKEVTRITNVSRGTIFAYLSEFTSAEKSKKLLKALRNKSKSEGMKKFKIEPKLYLAYSTEFEELNMIGKIKLRVEKSDIGQSVYVILN